MQALEDNRIYLSHKRAVLFIDTDLLSLLPDVGSQPAALRWEDKVLACNKAARTYGVSDNQPFGKAVQLCPGLITLGAEHISPLAEIVNQVNKVLRTYSSTLERVNVDECYIDVTEHPHLALQSKPWNGTTRGFNSLDSCQCGCPCGCQGLLSAARLVGEQLQSMLSSSLRVRSRVGVSSSKLLARLAAFRASLDQCRVIFPDEVRELFACESTSCVLPEKIATDLQSMGIQTTADIRSLSLNDLQAAVGLNDAVSAVNAACGVDVSPVVTCDLWRLFCVEYELREKFCVLLLRLTALADEDGRTPLALKVSVRKWDPVRKTCSKEAKTAPIACGLSSCGRTSRDAMAKIMTVIMTLLRRLVDMNRPFQLTLLGLAFVRFHEQAPRLAHPASRSVASCLLRKRELSVESPVNVSFEGDGTQLARPSKDNEAQPESSDVEEPSPREKKAKLDFFIKSKKFHDEVMECSPSKLKVADLTLSEEAKSTRNFLHW